MLTFLINLSDSDEYFKKGLGKVGYLLEEYGLGGYNDIRATILLHAGFDENHCFLQKQIERALNAFSQVLSIQRIEDITSDRNGKLYFKERIFANNLSAPLNNSRSRPIRTTITGVSPLLPRLWLTEFGYTERYSIFSISKTYSFRSGPSGFAISSTVSLLSINKYLL